MSAEAPSRPPPPKRPVAPTRQVSLPTINFDEPMYDATDMYRESSKYNSGSISSPFVTDNKGSSSPPIEDSIMRLRQEVEALTKQDDTDTISARPTKQDVPDTIQAHPINKQAPVDNLTMSQGTTIVTVNSDLTYSQDTGSGNKDETHEARDPPQSPSHPPPRDSQLSQLKRASTRSGDSLGPSDLLPGIPCVPGMSSDENIPNVSTNTNQTRDVATEIRKDGLLCVEKQDLLVITPTSGEALPIPNLKPEIQERSDEYISDAESSATGGCDDDAERYQDFEGEQSGLMQSGTMSAHKSWNEEIDLHDDISKDCMQFMKGFVSMIFEDGSSMSQADKAKFGELCRHGSGRLWFSRYMNAQRVKTQKVDEQVFYRLVQFFAVCLFECGEEEDYVPAKTMMNMCFTYYHEVDQPMSMPHKDTAGRRDTQLQLANLSQAAGLPANLKATAEGGNITLLSAENTPEGLRVDMINIQVVSTLISSKVEPTNKQFLYMYLRDQPIWQSLRFWNAAFFDAVMAERMRRPAAKRGDGSQEKIDDQHYQENITFGQLATFTSNMRSFGLSKELCLEFLRKQSTIADLRDAHVRLLKENIEKWQD
jgi:hypothetical protein